MDDFLSMNDHEKKMQFVENVVTGLSKIIDKEAKKFGIDKDECAATLFFGIFTEEDEKIYSKVLWMAQDYEEIGIMLDTIEDAYVNYIEGKSQEGFSLN
jgi:hypothetical protein